MTPYFERLKQSRWLNDDLVKCIFDNIKNSTVAALVIWAAAYIKENPYGENAIVIAIIWRVLIYGGLALLFLNMHHGFKKISEYIRDPFFRWFTCALYLLFSVGLCYISYRHNLPIDWNPSLT